MRLKIEKSIYGGAGLARLDGKAIFVPFALPGETVEAQIVEDKRSFANAELEALLEPSPERTSPACEYFGQCGGCQYQHASYPQQIAIKLGILRETLERARLASIPEIVPVFGEALAYRNRARLHVQREPFALCYKKRSSHENLPVRHCPIAAPLLRRAIEVVTRSGGEFVREFDEIEFFTNENESELLISLWLRQRSKDLSSMLTRLCEGLRQELPALAGAAVFSSGGGRGPEKKTAGWGAQSIMYRAAGFAYRVSAGSFFQMNRFLTDRLVALVAADFSGKLMWDLYAGVGLFARAMGQRFDKVMAVEGSPFSASDLRQNLSGGAHKAINSGTLEFLRQQHGAAPDMVVVDPPRTGLGSSVVSLLTKVRARSIVYVSCDPATLARDLHALVESGYHLRTMHMVDLFPQTFHLESITVMSLD